MGMGQDSHVNKSKHVENMLISFWSTIIKWYVLKNVGSILILQDWADTQLVYIEVDCYYTTISHSGMFCNWLELITCTILLKLIKKG